MTAIVALVMTRDCVISPRWSVQVPLQRVAGLADSANERFFAALVMRSSIRFCGASRWTAEAHLSDQAGGAGSRKRLRRLETDDTTAPFAAECQSFLGNLRDL